MYLNDASELISDEAARRLTRRVMRYHEGSSQDANPVIAFLHNSYAVADVDSLWELSTPEQVKRAAGEDLRKLRDEVLRVQDRLERMGLKALKMLKARGVDLVKVAEEIQGAAHA